MNYTTRLPFTVAAASLDHLRTASNAPSVIEGFVRAKADVMTPLEAAVANEILDTMQFLTHHGARVDATTLPDRLCLAKLKGAADIKAYLRQQAPPEFAPRYESVRLP